MRIISKKSFDYTLSPPFSKHEFLTIYQIYCFEILNPADSINSLSINVKSRKKSYWVWKGAKTLPPLRMVGRCSLRTGWLPLSARARLSRLWRNEPHYHHFILFFCIIIFLCDEIKPNKQKQTKYIFIFISDSSSMNKLREHNSWAEMDVFVTRPIGLKLARFLSR